jgi:hypothetical protein
MSDDGRRSAAPRNRTSCGMVRWRSGMLNFLKIVT